MLNFFRQNLDKIWTNLDKFRTHQNLDNFRENLDKFRTPRFTDDDTAAGAEPGGVSATDAAAATMAVSAAAVAPQRIELLAMRQPLALGLCL